MSPVSGGGAGIPVAVCGRFPSVFRQTTDCPAQTLTVSCAEPILPATVAWIATGPPTFTAVARPLELTVATVPVVGLQVGAGALATALPRASRAVAANCWVVQRGMDAVGGSRETVATTCWTVTPSPGAALLTWLDALATTCAVPFAAAVTRPDALALATAGASLVQVNVAPATGLLPASRAVATSWTVSPRLASEAEEAPPEVVTDT